MKKNLFVILLQGCFILSHAQVIQDFVVTNQNDTIYGKIKQGDDLMKTIRFKSEKDTDFKTLSAQDIKSFMDDNRFYYESQNISARGKEKQDVFLKCLVKGDVSLFSRKNYFYIMKSDTLMKIEKKDTVFSNLLREDNRYIGLLKVLLPDSKETDQALKTINYSPGDLSSIIGNYNKFINPAHKNITYRRGILQSVKVGLRVSMVASTMKYGYPSDSKYYGSMFKTSIGYSAGIFVVIPMTKRFSIQPELSITQKGGSGDQTIKTFGTTPRVSRNFFDVSLTFLQIPLTFNYVIPAKKFTLLISLGGVVGHAIALKSNLVVKQYKGPEFTEAFDTENTKLPIDKPELGYRSGFGITVPFMKTKKIGFIYYYEKTFGNYTFFQDKIKYNTNAFGLSYIF